MSDTAKPAPGKPAPAKAEVKPASGEPEARPEPKTSKPEPEVRAEARMGSKINNAPAVTNTGGYELKVVPPKPEKIGMAGHNTGGYELRVSQEQGTH